MVYLKKSGVIHETRWRYAPKKKLVVTLYKDVRSIRSHSGVQRERWKLPTSSKFFYEGSNAFQFVCFFVLKIKNWNKIIS